MAEGFFANSIKCALFVVNLFFWVGGIAIFALGVWVKTDGSALSDHIRFVSLPPDDPLLVTGSDIAIGLGVVIFLIGFCGCFGAIQEYRCLLYMYAACVCLIILLELGGAILLVFLRQEIETLFMKNLRNKVETMYTNGSAVQLAWDYLQSEMKCCGVLGPNDWEQTLWFQQPPAQENGTQILWVPASCCSPNLTTAVWTGNTTTDSPLTCQYEVATQLSPTSDLYKEGCYTKVRDWVLSHLKFVWIIAGASVAIQILVFFFACYLSKKVHDEKLVGVIA